MKIFKSLIVLFLIISFSPFIIAFVSPKEYSIQREITINKPKNEVFDFSKFLKNQDKFSKWASMEPNMEKSYLGVDEQ